MVDQKAVRLAVCLTVGTQRSCDRLALLPGIDENKAFFSPCVLEDIAHSRVCVLGSAIRALVQNRKSLLGSLLLLRDVLLADVEVLHGQPPAVALGLDLGDNSSPAGAGGKKTSGSLKVADRS